MSMSEIACTYAKEIRSRRESVVKFSNKVVKYSVLILVIVQMMPLDRTFKLQYILFSMGIWLWQIFTATSQHLNPIVSVSFADENGVEVFYAIDQSCMYKWYILWNRIKSMTFFEGENVSAISIHMKDSWIKPLILNYEDTNKVLNNVEAIDKSSILRIYMQRRLFLFEKPVLESVFLFFVSQILIFTGEYLFRGYIY
jgi:hypothetical protein